MSWLSQKFLHCQQLLSQACIHLNRQHAIRNVNKITVPQASLSTTVSTMTTGPSRRFEAESPYKKPGKKRYGFQNKLYDGGLLPRGLAYPLESLKPYRPKNVWSKKRALFGQNDYIDILGDGSIHPVDLYKTPSWLRGFNGNELQRLVRRMNFEGHKMRVLYPTQYHQTWKRIKYLYKKYNQKRGKRIK